MKITLAVAMLALSSCTQVVTVKVQAPTTAPVSVVTPSAETAPP